MHTVDLLEEAIGIGRQLGYQVRHEWLDGSGGGACQFGGKRWLFIDLALSTTDQLDQIVSALSEDARCQNLQLSPALSRLVTRPQAA
jgi:hypothetical protein